MSEWQYKTSSDGSARYVLGQTGSAPLIFFGINPSTAVPNQLDPTVTRVQKRASLNGFDGWTMLNVYPQISTDPDGLHHEFDATLKSENEDAISSVFRGQELTVVAAWGDLIAKRPFLLELLRDISALPSLGNCRWVSIGDVTKKKNPRHALYQRYQEPLREFELSAYLAQ